MATFAPCCVVWKRGGVRKPSRRLVPQLSSRATHLCTHQPATRYPPLPARQTTLWGRKVSNPIGLAAGFDKNAEARKPTRNFPPRAFRASRTLLLSRCAALRFARARSTVVGILFRL